MPCRILQHRWRKDSLFRLVAIWAGCWMFLCSWFGKPSTFAQLSPEARARQWNLMKENFGSRWEGKTRWFSAGAQGASPMTEAMPSIYQLEFPHSTPELGTWRGWGVIKPGDTRVVPLSEATVVDRTPGSATFQFEGVGGRNSLRTDGDTWGAEVNFFHSGRRSGLVLYFKDGKPNTIMSMAFRSMPISNDGNQTFVKTADFTAEPSDSIQESYAQPEMPLLKSSVKCTRRFSLDACHKLSSTEQAGVSWRETEEALYYVAGLPDLVYLKVPKSLSPGAKLGFACDFRPIGGPLRSLSVCFQDVGLCQWICEDFVD